MKDSVVQQLDRLERHLREENPILLDAVRSFRRLDEAVWRLGLLSPDESLANQVPWWPLIAVLGTFSAGKSTFINGYVGQAVQLSGNQAVDDRFTAICFSAQEGPPRALPGLALDADPRFPFYQVSRDIEEVAPGEGRRIDAYLQLKTCSSPELRGKIIIDSPGFDADEQRTSVLRIADHIIGLADLVLVFFDARHPEPGAMQDTLRHLVSRAVERTDLSKFLYILNQVDNTAREDNPEEVFGAWQRALAANGLTAGRFYQIYDEASAIPIENEGLRDRFRTKRDADLADIHTRMGHVEEERAYRVIGMLEKLALVIRDEAVPALARARAEWRKRVLWADAALLGLVVVVLAALGGWIGFGAMAGGLASLGAAGGSVAAVVVLAAAGYVHFLVRRRMARVRAVRRCLAPEGAEGPRGVDPEWLQRAFDRNAAWWRTMWRGSPFGWGGGTQRRIAEVLEEAGRYVQRLNDRFADPSGRGRVGADPHPPPGAVGRGGADPASPAASASPSPGPNPNPNPAAGTSGAHPPDRGDGEEAGERHRREDPEPAVGARDGEPAEQPRL